ncbi:PAS/PAC sensor signal transduction histidine kinase [Tamilnaduibacter salinus]|uniref:Phosphate regulon sensor protein PhoR n=1 Tax=Tamilnaduibacter salinus TaxID=1484056 RepID=A0A2A2I1S5_9GAMM|nr:phosphate regulon sensor histidine kinase PhoR [Tamilnaduibacter salinus]PAV25679.1 PAS domain-containing sensor histidine kinase [Tamilnaduibacter salinus]PVY76346.1 PAS/PAC sensor signal transduction histidine kinase [Tamilnaduibacter salinus]
MHYSWSRYLRLILLFLLACLLFGAWMGYPLVGLLLGLAAYFSWTLVQIRRLHTWLSNPDHYVEAPGSVGLWGDLFDGLHRLHQKHLRLRDRLQTQLNRVQESTNAMREAVVMTDSNGTMEWWNGAAEYLLGFRRDTDLGQPVHNLLRHPEFKTYFDNRNYREPLSIRSPAKPHIHLQIQISLFGDDDRLIVARDVTRLTQLEQMRRDFVSNVSHEMRTPLTVLNGYLETLLDSVDDVAPKWRRPLETMNRQAGRMEALIKDLMLLSRLETDEHQMDDEITDVRKLLEQICQDARALSGDRAHQIELSIDDRHFLYGDEGQLRSAFSNIVFNAVKYTPDSGLITVHWVTDRDGAHLSVTDSGIGIDPIHIPRLTERFYRADPSRHQDTGGTGLGLAIVKHVLLNHDGQLEITSHPGEGSTFICHFPRRRITESPEAA